VFLCFLAAQPLPLVLYSLKASEKRFESSKKDRLRADEQRSMAKKPKLGKRGEGTSSFLGEEDVGQHILALEHLPDPSVVEDETRIVSVVVT
jgi:hypothetical protein